jgi:hypothetical protein
VIKPITDAVQVARYGRLFGEMMLTGDGEECDFNLDWIRSHGWKVVPAESMSRIPQPDIPRIVAVLRGAGFHRCVVVFNEPGYLQSLPVIVPSEPQSDLATCYQVSVDEVGFTEINRQLGPFRFIVSDESRSWTISCNEWYNLFAGKPHLVEALMGKPIEDARQDFLDGALRADGYIDESLLGVASRYASL